MFKLIIGSLLTITSICFAQQGITRALQPGQHWTYKIDPTEVLNSQDKNVIALRAIYQNEVISQILPLLPKKFQLVYPVTPDLQMMIDAIHFSTIQTPTGKEICKKGTGGRLDQIDEIYGIQGPLALSIQSFCRDSNVPVHRNYSTTRSFGILFYDGDAPPFESWTSRFNATIIAIGPNDRNEKYLSRALIHELAVKMDSKNNLSAKENLGDLYSGSNTCEVMSLLRNPMIRATFSTIRALEIEEALLSELGMPIEHQPSMKCEEKFLSVLPSVIELSQAFFLENVFLNETLTRQCPQSLAKINSLNKIIDFLSKTQLKVSSRELSLCQFMSAADLSNDSMTLYSNGPRPRMGDGTSKSAGRIEDLDLRMKLQNESFLKTYSELQKRDPMFEEKLRLEKLELGPALPKEIRVNQFSR